MKAISIRQPWAHAIMHFGKDIENRDWPTRFRGTVAIHAAKGLTQDQHLFATQDILDICGIAPPEYPMRDLRGCILGTVEIVDCVSYSESPWFMGEYGFVLKNAKLLDTPFPCRGALGFWDVPNEIEAQLYNL